MFFALSEAGMPILELKSNKLTLEQIFLKLTSEEAFLAMQKKQEKKRENAIKAMDAAKPETDVTAEPSETDETEEKGENDDDRNIKA